MEGHAIESAYKNRDGNPTLIWEEPDGTQRVFMKFNGKLVHNPAAENDDSVPLKIIKNWYKCNSYSLCLCKASAFPSVEGDNHGNLINITIQPPPPINLPPEYGLGSHHMDCPDQKDIIFRAIEDRALVQTAVRGNSGKLAGTDYNASRNRVGAEQDIQGQALMRSRSNVSRSVRRRVLKLIPQVPQFAGTITNGWINENIPNRYLYMHYDVDVFNAMVENDPDVLDTPEWINKRFVFDAQVFGDEPEEDEVDNRSAFLILGTKPTILQSFTQQLVNGDGTFYSCPPPYKQTFSIQYYVGPRLVPAAIVFMTHKSSFLYQRVFESLQNFAIASGVQIQWTRFMADFETGMGAAILARFGANVQIKGCHFHYCQAVYKNLVRFHMRQAYVEDQNLRHLVALLFSLPFLPLHLVEVGMNYINHLRATQPDIYYAQNANMNEFMGYFTGYWMPVNMRPRWNVFELADRRSNNNMEGNF